MRPWPTTRSPPRTSRSGREGRSSTGDGTRPQASEEPRMGLQMTMPLTVSLALLLPALVVRGGEPPTPTQVKVAAVQMLGYDKTDLPRPGFDPSEAVVRYIEKA